MDVQTLQQELEQLRKEKEEAKQRLDAFRPGANRLGPVRDHATPYSRDEQQEHGPHDDDHGRGMDSMQQSGPAGRGMGMRGGRGGVFARLTGGALNRQLSGGRHNGQFAGMGRADRSEHDDRVGNGHDAPFNRGMGLGGPPMGARRFRQHGDHDDRDGRGFKPYRDLDRPEPNFSATTQAAVPSSSRRKVLSSVVVDKGETRQGDEDKDSQQHDTHKEQEPNQEYDPQQNDQHAAGSKRPAADDTEPAADAPAEAHIRKRNKRMFGALLGTLQRFRNEDAQFQNSEVAAKRDAALRKAEAREKLESERLRRKEADARAAARDEELARLGSLSLAADCKLLELMYASRIARKEKMSHCLVTKAQPAIYWSPAQPNPATKKLLEAQQQELQEWKADMLTELETEKEGLKTRSAARREAALSRRAARAERIAAARAAGDASLAAAAAQYSKEDEEADRDAQAGEYARPQSNGDDQEEGETDTQHAPGRRRRSASHSRSPPGYTNNRAREEDEGEGTHGRSSPSREQDQANEEDQDQEMQDDKEGDDNDLGDKDLEAVTVEDLLA